MKFADSCQTLSLKTSDIFISSFPGKIVFGEPNCKGYKTGKTFQYRHSEFFSLYTSIVKIVQYLAVTSNNQDKGVILTRNAKTVYFWIGTCIEEPESRETEKAVKLGIELNSNIIFEVILNSEQLNELIYAFSLLMFSCLCLKSNEREFLENVTNELSIVNIINIKKQRESRTYIKKVIKERQIDSVTSENLYQLLIYYNEIIILYKKIKSLHNSEINEDRRIEAILNH